MANRTMPSMLALLGLLAFAGYQNRDKIAAAIKEAKARRDSPGAPRSGLDDMLAGVGDFLDKSGDFLEGSKDRGGLAGGLNDLLDGFRSHGQAETADSWIRPGPNRGLTPDQVEEAVGAENIAELTRRTGLSRDELLQRLAKNIPDTVDGITPDGNLPKSEDELLRRLG
jgi:uncharacterized protein YidB (DUF937 family)